MGRRNAHTVPLTRRSGLALDTQNPLFFSGLTSGQSEELDTEHDHFVLELALEGRQDTGEKRLSLLPDG